MEILYVYVSITLFSFAIYYFWFSRISKVNRFWFCLLFLFLLSMNLFFYLVNYFTGSGINSAAIYHLKYGLAGADYFEYWQLILISSVYIIVGIIFSVWLYIKKQSKIFYSKKFFYLSIFLLIVAIGLNPAISDLFGLYKYIYNNPAAQALDFNKYYKEPIIKPAGANKNLIYIYAEGLERTYFDETIFPDLIKELRRLEGGSTYFSNIGEVAGGEATVSGIVSSQCGIPLFSPKGDWDSIPETDGYLSRALCLSDLLHDEGYYQVYYGGVDTGFAGKGKFFNSHKYDEVYGKLELTLGKRGLNTGWEWRWGLYDDTLLDLAFLKAEELIDTQEKFALFLLTLDTHHPIGHPSHSCQDIIYRDGSNPILNAVACSDFLISNFADKVLSSPIASNTVIVVASDHLAHKNTAFDLLNTTARRNLFMVIEPNKEKSVHIDKLGSTLDIGSTILPFIGYEGVIGLGRDLMGEDHSVSEILEIQSKLAEWKRPISRFWGFPTINEFVLIDLNAETINIDENTYSIPALVELNENLETNIKFNNINLGNEVLSLPEDTPFLLVDNFNTDDYYLIIGIGRDQIEKKKIDPVIKLTANEIRFFLDIEPEYSFSASRVAHAGGGIAGDSLLNSIDALDHNLANGFDYFEIDLSFTSDSRLVCIHDWHTSFAKSFGITSEEIPTYKEFINLVNKTEQKNCTLYSLVSWLENNPSAFIITDVKEDNILALEIIADNYPGIINRVIPQVYDPNNYFTVKKIGYEQVIWTLYRYPHQNDFGKILDWVEGFSGPFAVTMPQELAKTKLPQELKKKGIPTYVHTVNNIKDIEMFKNEFGITEIYTDFLFPL